MNIERYDLVTGKLSTVFEFISEGVNGKIPKIIEYAETSQRGIYNLGFGDKDLLTGGVDDLSVSNNGDTEKILATVVSSLYAFTAQYPNARVYATGSTIARNRLYRMGITKYLVEVNRDFDVLGLVGDEWRPFEKGQEYKAFLAKRKNIFYDN